MSSTAFSSLTRDHGPGKTRRSVACSHCRTRKIRCNGQIPCTNCLDRSEECVVVSRRPYRKQGDRGVRAISRRHHSTSADSPSSHRQNGQGNPSLESAGPNHDQRVTHIVPTSTDDNVHHKDRLNDPETAYPAPDSLQDVPENFVVQYPLTFVHYQADDTTINSPNDNRTSHQDSLTPHQTEHDDISVVPHSIVPRERATFHQNEHEDSSVYASDTLNQEYYGPRSFLSFSSQPGVVWINSKVKSTEFSHVATRMITEMARMLKMSRTPSAAREPEPPAEVQRQYTKAYFEEAPEAAFNVVNRSWFESRLSAPQNGTTTDDKAWYALRSVLWASGSRISLSKSKSFGEASRSSWALFENALSVHTEIQLLRASLVAVQALVLMAYYAEGVGKTSLQYMLCSTAMRLACSKGLHRQPPRSWKIPPYEAKHRNWIFWSIYCLEKQICTRSGRPSSMDDDDVSTLVPQSALTNSSGDTMYCHILVEMMQLCSRAKKRLSCSRGLAQVAENLIETVRTLAQELEDMKIRFAIQYNLCLDEPLDLSRLPVLGLTLRQAQSLQAHYCCLVLDINTPLSYPWSGVHAYAEQDLPASAQVEKSCSAVVQAARRSILGTRQIQFDASCTALASLYTPFYSSINLFIHILRDTSMSSTKSDLMLLEIAVGYFSSLELTTDFELSVSLVREMSHFARLALERGNNEIGNGIGGDLDTYRNITELSRDTFPNNCVSEPAEFDIYENEFFGSLPDETFEMWSTLLPFTDMDDLVL